MGRAQQSGPNIREIAVIQLCFFFQSHFLYTVVILFICTLPATLGHRGSGFRVFPIPHFLFSLRWFQGRVTDKQTPLSLAVF